jgi:homospermidine synthase
MGDEITTGADLLGALIMGHAFNSWWTGSDLSIQQARKLVPHQNATTLQVAISVVAASMWMFDHPEEGVCSPEDLPHEFVLKIADPYLGKNLSLRSDWTPLKHYENHFQGYARPDLDRKDPGIQELPHPGLVCGRPPANHIQNSEVRIQKVG